MMDIRRLGPSDVLKEEYLAEYDRGIRLLYSQLIDLNVDIFIIEHIVMFPWPLLCTPEETIFFSMVARNFADIATLIITRLATDKGPGLYTLRGFRDLVYTWAKEEHRGSLREALKQAKFDKKSRELQARARVIRDSRIAHLKPSWLVCTPDSGGLMLRDLQRLRDDLNSLLDTVAFNVEHCMLPMEYEPEVERGVGIRRATDIELLLTDVARRSPLLTLPERCPARWHRRRARLSRDDLATLNEYRDRLGLGPA